MQHVSFSISDAFLRREFVARQCLSHVSIDAIDASLFSLSLSLSHSSCHLSSFTTVKLIEGSLSVFYHVAVLAVFYNFSFRLLKKVNNI